MSVHVKICGVRTVDDALAAVEAGATAVGLNFVPSSPRFVDIATARAISRALVRTKALVVGVVANLDVEEMRALVTSAELGCLQLHGDETAADVEALLPHAYKAMPIANDDDVHAARAMPGDYLLVDAKVDGALGGSGETFEWSLVRLLATERRLTLAGGLNAGNVAEAVRVVRPWCVDVASGVESAPGVKDYARMRAFVDAVRSA